MRLVPLQQWLCDTCGEVIDLTSEDKEEREEAGYFEWKTVSIHGTIHRDTGFHIVHHAPRAPDDEWGACQYPDDRAYLVQNLGLTNLLGTDGLAYLLGILDNHSEHIVVEEFTHFLRRLQIPHYEEARQYFADGEIDNLFEGRPTEYLYSQDMLVYLIERYGDAQ